jgi:ubiquinone/menaquinone biosynthesis C-methylase UbiE
MEDRLGGEVQRVNYDLIAPLYDEPGRDHEVDPNLLDFLNQRPHLSPDSLRILDVGCGTGKQLAANRSRFPEMDMLGVDLFAGMLRIAKKRSPRVAWVQGDAACLPLPAACYDYITNQFSYTHIQRKEAFLHEIYRVLKPGGRFVIRHIDPFSMPNWILYHFFPASRQLDFRDSLPAEIFEHRLHSTGFVQVRVDRQSRADLQSLVGFLEYANSRHRTSQLIAIPDEDYQTGIRRLQAEIDKRGSAAVFRSQFCLITIQADKPPASSG